MRTLAELLRSVTKPGLFIACTLGGIHTEASTCNTITSGEISNPLIWDCGCAPSTCDTLFIDHAVSANESLTFSNALVNVTFTGSLASTDTLTFTGLFQNDGAVDVRRIVQPFGTHWWVNNGTITASVLWLWGDSALNTGTMHAIDTLNLGQYSIVTNHGRMDGDFFWAGGFYNFDTLAFQGANLDLVFVNLAYAHFGACLVSVGTLFNEPSAYLEVDTLLDLNSIENNGFMKVGRLLQIGRSDLPFQCNLDHFPFNAHIECGNLKNFGHIQGHGDICVQDSSINYATGLIDLGPDICDATLSTSVEPFLDVNLGTVGSAVGWCAQTSCITSIFPTTVNEVVLVAFPVPANSQVSVQFPFAWSVASVSLFETAGRLVRTTAHIGLQEVSIERGSLPEGFYFALLRDNSGMVLGKASIIFSNR